VGGSADVRSRRAVLDVDLGLPNKVLAHLFSVKVPLEAVNLPVHIFFGGAKKNIWITVY
jgi:hypothetical protein